MCGSSFHFFFSNSLPQLRDQGPDRPSRRSLHFYEQLPDTDECFVRFCRSPNFSLDNRRQTEVVRQGIVQAKTIHTDDGSPLSSSKCFETVRGETRVTYV